MTKQMWWRSLLILCALCVPGILDARAQVQPAATPEPQRQDAAPPASSGAAQSAPSVTDAADGRVPLSEAAVSRGTNGEALIAATLRAVPAMGTPDAPVANVRFVIENRSAAAYSLLSGRVTFYDAAGVRCGEGLFTANSLAASERAEVDAPGLRLICAPAAWRIVPVALVTGGALMMNTPTQTTALATTDDAPRLSININGTVMPVQLGNPVEIEVGSERVRIIVTRDAVTGGKLP